MSTEWLEAGSPAAVVFGVTQFVALVTAAVCVGWAALTLLRFPAEPLRRLLLAPFAATVLWALAGNLAVRFGFTLGRVTPWIMIASLGLAVVGIGSMRRHLRLGPLALLVGFGVLAGCVAWPYFARGLAADLGSSNPDTTHYTSIAAAFWRHGLDPTSAPEPFFRRYADSVITLGRARNHAFVLGALFSPAAQPGEPLFVRNLFVCWSIFLLACNLAFYRLSWGDRAEGRWWAPRVTVLYVLLTAGIGWAVYPTLIGNWDNGLLVSVGPVLAALARDPATEAGYAVLLGGTVAYSLYAYTELAPLLGLFVLPLSVRSLLSRAPLKRALVTYALAGAVALVLLAPGAEALWSYLRYQTAASRAPIGHRPGGAFAQGLVDRPWDFSGWWVLGGEHGAPVDWRLWALGLLLSGVALAGVVRLMRHREWGEVGGLALVAAALVYFVFGQRYGYAVYKILSVGWWLIGRCLVEGGALVLGPVLARPDATRVRRLQRGAAAGALAVLLAGSFYVAERRRFETFFSGALVGQQPTLPALVRLRAAAATQPPMDVLVSPALSDFLTLPWVFYAFKDTPVRLYHPAKITVTVPGGAVWPPEGPSPAAVLVRAGALPGARTIFQTPEYALVDLEDTAVVEGIDSPNGPEVWGTWLGTQPVTISVLARRSLAVALTFEAAPGPSRPETSRRTLLLKAGSREVGRMEIDGPGRVAFRFVTTGGRDVLTLSTPDVPTVPVLANGDRRALLVSVRDLRVTPVASGQ
jgi:hypothetical protein